MITTIRMTKENVKEDSKIGGVGLLERTPSTYEEFANPISREESMEEAKIRMQRNLEKLLNYDKVEDVSDINSETNEEIAEMQTVVSDLENQAEGVKSFSDDDIRPTSTTMQFGSDDKETVFKDMERQNQGSDNKYHLTLQGKVATVIYSIALAIIFALIIINTGVLSSLSVVSAQKTMVLAEKQQQVEELYEKIAEISSDEHVMEIAETELEMMIGR